MAAEAGARAGAGGLSWTKLLERLRAQMVRRLGWGVADQAMSSLTNAAVSIYVVHTLGAVQFGAFSLALVTYWFALNASRGFGTDPLMVRFSGTDVATWRRAIAGCTGTAVGVGVTTGVCVLVVAVFLHGTTRAAFIALGLTLPGLLLQDSWRFSFFALGRGGQAFLNDLIWAIILFPAMVILRMTGHTNVFWYFLAWGGAAAVAAAVGPLQAKAIPRLSGSRAWVYDHRDLGPRYAAEGLSSASSTQLRAYAISFILGLAAVGYVQAASTLMGPFLVIFFGMSLVMIPEAARVLRRSPRRLPQFCLLMGGGLAVAGVAWGLLLLVALPRGLGNLLLGPVWRPTYPLVLPQALSCIGLGLSAGAGAGLHALGAAKRSLRGIMLGSAVAVICAVTGALAAGAIGTVYGIAISSSLGALVLWSQLHGALREYRAAAAPDTRANGEPSSIRPSGKHRRVVEVGQPVGYELPSPAVRRDVGDDVQLTLPMPRVDFP
jgi:O-antigen/teichoic acid export membrane protein